MEGMDPSSPEVIRLFGLLGQLLAFSEAEIHALVAVFARIGAAAALLPGFGEMVVPQRVKLVGALAFTALVWPAVLPGLDIPSAPPIGENAIPALSLGRLILAETVCGLALGLTIRFLVFALQLAGSIAAQATSVAQIFGAGATPDPMPAIGNILVLAGIALALAGGLHVKATAAMIESYSVLPFGVFPVAGDLAEWGVGRAASAFGLAFTLAAPFLVAALVYNVALGAINRAMPQLMVAFVGAPAITAGALIFLLLCAPAAILHWSGMLDEAFAAPFRGR